MTLLNRLRTHRKFGFALISRVLARLLASLGQAGFLLLLARELGPSQFGAVAVVLAVGFFFSAITSFGSSTRVLRLAAEDNQKQTATRLLYLRLWGTALSVVGCTVLAMFGGTVLAFLAVFMLASDQIVDYVQAYFAGSGRQMLSSLVILVQRLIPFITIGTMVLLGSFSAELIALCFVLTLTCSLVAPIRERSRATKFWSRDIWTELRSSTGYWMSGLAPNVSQLQPPLLSLILDAASVGFFAITSRLTNPLTILVGALQTLLIPELAKRRGTPQFHKLYRSSVAASAIYGLLLSACAWLIADVMVAMLGQAYSEAHALIVSMTVAAAMSALAQAYQSKLLAEGRPSTAALIVGVGSAVGLVALLSIALLGGVTWLWLSPLVTQGLIVSGLAIRANAKLPKIGSHS